MWSAVPFAQDAPVDSTQAQHRQDAREGNHSDDDGEEVEGASRGVELGVVEGGDVGRCCPPPPKTYLTFFYIEHPRASHTGSVPTLPNMRSAIFNARQGGLRQRTTRL